MKMMRSRLMSFAYLPAMFALLAVPAPLFAKGNPSDPDNTIDGPLLDKMSDSGALYGDLYRIARYKGGETKNVPVYDEDGDPVYTWEYNWEDPDGKISIYPVKRQVWTTGIAVGGEPILTEDFAVYTILDEELSTEDNPVYVINQATGGIYYPAPLPSQCVQPVAEPKWGLEDNLILLVKTYDPTWERTECAVSTDEFLAADETLEDVFDQDDHHVAISYSDLVQEVEFGRLNLARAPKAVLDASFDEAIRSLNAAKDIKIDASGRLMVTTDIYDEFLIDENNDPLVVDTVEKAIDSPKENLALYLKLIEDGHLVTPADERAPIDYSLYGGMPLSQLLELVDGPSDAPRPTIDIVKMESFGLGYLVDAGAIVSYSIRMESDGSLYLDVYGNMDITCTAEELVDDQYCVEYEGILTSSDSDKCAGEDFPLAASFFSAAADKKGNITVDKIVYTNSILGINKVVGYSAYDEDGKPLDDAINYSKNPVYFNYETLAEYNRFGTYGIQADGNAKRGRAQEGRNDGEPYVYDGMVEYLEESSTAGTWVKTPASIHQRVFVDQEIAEPQINSNIGGFTAMSDDDLQVIIFTHTYQIPELR